MVLTEHETENENRIRGLRLLRHHRRRTRGRRDRRRRGRRPRPDSSILNPKSSFRNPGFQPFGFQSGLYDPDTGLVQFRARWYDPSTGRWLSKDPILLEGGLNLYAFCGNDPVNFRDPWGLCERHYNRNQNQTGNLPKSPEEAEQQGFSGDVPARYHQQGGQAGNRKFVHPDGREVVFNSAGEIVADVVNQGTYNFSNPKTDPWGHFINDMLPYYILGNAPNDPTTVFERITGTYTDDVSGRVLPNPVFVITITIP